MTTIAAVYARISADQHGTALGVTRQVQDCTAKAEALGWTVAETFVDNDVSASKNVERPEYRRLLAAIEAGIITALVVYDLDRLTRKPKELEEFMELADATGVRLANVSGEVDLTTANGQMLARIKGAVAAQEAKRIAERTKRQKQQRIEAGKPLGQRFRTFGYERDWSVNETEAEIVREVFARSAAGESQNAITADLQARGIQTAAGGTWTQLQTSRMLHTPKYAGFQTYQGKVVGKSSVVPALVSEAEYEAVQVPAKTHSTGNMRKYLLSGILICDSCKAPMTGTRVKTDEGFKVRYRCDKRSGGCGTVSIKATWVEDLVDRYMTWWVINENAKREASTSTGPIGHEAEIAAVDARIASFQEAMGTGAMDAEDAIAAIRAARKQRAVLVKEDAAAVTEALDASRVFEAYDTLNEAAKRDEIKRVFKFIFVKTGRRSTKFEIGRLSVLRTWDSSPVPAAAIDTYDLREGFNQGV